jgi:IclR family transcriptional regulator, acetate operon repressor
LAVKPSQSASRVLAVLEQVASRQPIGVSALAKLLGEDKSAVQRAVVTLADAGWIRIAPEPPTRWELTAHIFTVAHLPYSSDGLRQRARPILEALRDQTGETAFLAIPDVRRFVVIEAAESLHSLRMALRIGQITPVRESATGRAVLPYLSPARQAVMLGEPPDADLLALLAETRARGFGLSVGEVLRGSTNLAAAVFGDPVVGGDGEPIAAITVSGPSDRLTADRHAEVGALVADAARRLSRGQPGPGAG